MGIQDALMAILGGNRPDLSGILSGGSAQAAPAAAAPPAAPNLAGDPMSILRTLLSGVPMSTGAGPGLTPPMNASAIQGADPGAPSDSGVSSALSALLLSPSRMAVSKPGPMGGMDGSLPMGPPSSLAGGGAPRISLNKNAAVDEPVDAELVSRGTDAAKPSIGERINDAAGDVFAGVKANPASGFASFASGFTGGRDNATARADKKRKDAWAGEDRTIAASERDWTHKRQTIADSRAAAAGGRAEGRAALQEDLTRAQIANLKAKGELAHDLTVDDVFKVQKYKDSLAKTLGRSNAYGDRAKEIDAEVERRGAIEENRIRRIRQGAAAPAAAGNPPGATSTTTAPDQVYTDGEKRIKWDGSAWVDAG